MSEETDAVIEAVELRAALERLQGLVRDKEWERGRLAQEVERLHAHRDALRDRSLDAERERDRLREELTALSSLYMAAREDNRRLYEALETLATPNWGVRPTGGDATAMAGYARNVLAQNECGCRTGNECSAPGMPGCRRLPGYPGDES